MNGNEKLRLRIFYITNMSNIPATLQQHLSTLAPEQRAKLEKDINSQNWELLATLAKDAKRQFSKQNENAADSDSANVIADVITPMNWTMLKDNPRFGELKKFGEDILKRGEAAAFLVAGGQGSRLGFEGPKGAFKLKLPNGEKSIFQIHAERLLELKRNYGKEIPFVIMTSPLNNKETIEHFERNNYFGLDYKKIKFIEQNTMCALTPNGEPILETIERLALVPDGNGGCFRALSKSGALNWLKNLGIKFIFLYGVDNVLAKPCDPAFLGAFADSGMAAASKVVRKKSPGEKMGVFAFKNSLPTVIEYSEIPQMRMPAIPPADFENKSFDKAFNAQAKKASAEFDGGNIVAHFFTIDSLEKLENEPLAWHLAVKKVKGFCLPAGNEVEKCIKNSGNKADMFSKGDGYIEGALKFEQFLFDAFPKLGSMFLAGVEREKEFAPVKNASGEDSPESAVKLLVSQCSVSAV